VTRVPAGRARALGENFWIGLVANFGGRCQQFVGVAKFIANSSTYCTYESCPTHYSVSKYNSRSEALKLFSSS
jgi:hypothetical protein